MSTLPGYYELEPENNHVMDKICDCLIKGKDIILDKKSLKQIENEF